jgi:ABC-type nickel/cobalt efflux system permease component RcnA
LVLQIPYGLGRHGYVVSVADRTRFEEITFWKTVFSDGVALGLLRISMAISLLRLKRDLKWYRWSLFAVMGMSP